MHILHSLELIGSVVFGFPNCCIWISKFYYLPKLLLGWVTTRSLSLRRFMALPKIVQGRRFVPLFNIETTLIWYYYHSIMVLRPLKYGVSTILTFKFSKLSIWYYDHSNMVLPPFLLNSKNIDIIFIYR